MTVAAPSVPPDLSPRSRTVLGLPPSRWYADHVADSIRAEVNAEPCCSCCDAAPDRRCDVGESLWRLRDRPGRGPTA